MPYYLYEIKFETGHVYYGMRRCDCSPELDKEYVGSPVTYAEYWKKYKFTKKILKVYTEEEKETCVEDERFLINWQWNATPEGKDKSLNGAINHKYILTKNSFNISSYFLVSPDLKFYSGKNIKKFCDEHNISYQNVFNIMSGKLRHYKGWTGSIQKHLEWKYFEGAKVQKPVSVYHPKYGDQVVYSRQIFADKYGINPSSLIALINKRYKSCKGWILSENKKEENYFIFINENLGLSFCTTLSKLKYFCNLYNLSRAKLKMVITKERNHHKNWKILS